MSDYCRQQNLPATQVATTSFGRYYVDGNSKFRKFKSLSPDVDWFNGYINGRVVLNRAGIRGCSVFQAMEIPGHPYGCAFNIKNVRITIMYVEWNSCFPKFVVDVAQIDARWKTIKRAYRVIYGTHSLFSRYPLTKKIIELGLMIRSQVVTKECIDELHAAACRVLSK